MISEKLREMLLQNEADQDGYPSFHVLEEMDRTLVSKARTGEQADVKPEP